ncbi:hypothetical protein F7731_11800 [Cytobacillus depressus]|uniref:Uncharacterized protein n=1 Tax=Cytobacillus depressus TaxID=1602942 RepID=A0A6L3V762_9BACI|nr:hypothetical protein [Cytobacillus depressus]KAB2336176.1 hypothetical protein F7731_11800 [Cytobacillus depressus]
MSTIETLYDDAIRYEEHVLAHYILCLIQEGKISLDDEESVLFEVQPDTVKLTKMIENNHLVFCQIHMYALKVGERKWAFIYAVSPEEAKTHLWKMTGSRALNCREMAPDEEVLIGNRFLNFREWKKEQKEFPCLVGYC